MRSLATRSVALWVLFTLGSAQAPDTQAPPFDASVRLIYESDARAYYRPCG